MSTIYIKASCTNTTNYMDHNFATIFISNQKPVDCVVYLNIPDAVCF